MVSQQLLCPPLRLSYMVSLQSFSSGTCPRHSCLAPSKGPSHQDGGCGPALAACLVSLPTFSLLCHLDILSETTELHMFLTCHVFLGLLPFSVDQRGVEPCCMLESAGGL